MLHSFCVGYDFQLVLLLSRFHDFPFNIKFLFPRLLALYNFGYTNPFDTLFDHRGSQLIPFIFMNQHSVFLIKKMPDFHGQGYNP
jgi:hypothetical protein